MQAVVLCGGLATRMLPATERVPKVLLEVGGRPFLHHVVARLRAAGFVEIVLCAGHLGDAIEVAALGLGRDVVVLRDGERLLGTAGALAAAQGRLAPSFLVTYGDSYLLFDYAAPLRALTRLPDTTLGVMTVWQNDGALEPSNAAVEGDRVVRYDKARTSGVLLDHIDYGAIALRRDALAAVASVATEGEPSSLSDLLEAMSRRSELAAHVTRERFYEIGSPAGLADLEAYLRASRRTNASAADKKRP